jgi:hypothetical protein
VNAFATLARRLAAGAAGLALLAAAGGTARAGYYAYSVQETSTYVFSGATVGAITPLSATSGAQTGSPSGSEAHSGTLDALQSYVGPGPRPAENTFTPLGQVNPSYVRGDALLTTAAFTTHNVAEGFLNGPGNSAGSGSWSVSAPITFGGSGTVTLSFNFTNLLTLVNAPIPTALSGSVAADYGYTFSIQDSAGATVFTSSPTAVNRSLSFTTPGSSSTPGSGSISITSGILGPGTYTATIAGSEHVFLNAIPEPSSAILLGCAGVTLVFGVFARRRLTPT